MLATVEVSDLVRFLDSIDDLSNPWRIIILATAAEEEDEEEEQQKEQA